MYEHRRTTERSRRRPRLTLAAGALALATIAGAARAADTGRLEEPRLSGYDASPSLDKTFTFSGWVTVAPSDGYVTIYAAVDGNGLAANGWRIVSDFNKADKGTTTVSGQVRYKFSVGPIAPFRLLKNQNSGANPWPEGGTGRLMVVAFRQSGGSLQPTVLPVRDSYDKNGSLEELVVADYNPTPTDNPATAPPYILLKGSGTPAQTDTYYSKIYSDPAGTDTSKPAKTTLDTFKKFKDRYFAAIPSSCASGSFPEQVTTYYNKGDLGLGREMHCLYNDCTKETACYVKNYGKRDGTPLFGNKAESFEAVKTKKPFATVAMVERGKMAVGAPNKVIFLVYDHAGVYKGGDPLAEQNASKLGLSAQLDNKGANTFIPGNCLACHGTNSSYDASTSQVKEAYFLPFDLQHGFDYYSSDSSNALSLAAQQGKFKELNKQVYFTDLWFIPQARELITGFYGGSSFSASTFKNDFVPAEWNGNDNQRQLYKTVVAKTCRTCHVSHSGEFKQNKSNLTFGRYDDFVVKQTDVHSLTCGPAHLMPHAEQTLKIFWQSSARAHLVNRMNYGAGCGL